MEGHLHADGLIHLVVEDDVGWLAPVYAYVSLCGVIHGDRGMAEAGNYISITSGHKAAQANCMRCILRAGA